MFNISAPLPVILFISRFIKRRDFAQEALKAKNKTVQVQEEAKQKVIAAEAEARSMAIRAQALSQNKSLVQYEAVQKWDGKMPQYMLGNSVPFINVNPAKQ